MLAIVYIVLCFLFGYIFCSFLLPDLEKYCDNTCEGRKMLLSRAFVLVPAWYITGTIFITWITYLSAYVFRNDEKPLFLGNVVSMGFALAVSVVGLIFLIRRKHAAELLKGARRISASEVVFIIITVFLAYTLMYGTLFVMKDRLYVGVSVFSDFAPHIGMIRSFSKGNNFPTTYSHFAGVDIRYHFLFQFMVANLEFLGMRLDHAFNLPSILSFVFAVFLLYALALRLFGKRAVGFLSCLFFVFRCSPTLLTYMGKLEKGTVLKTLIENTEFIGYTTHEDWGLWNLNVYCNQRHLASGICVLLLLIHIFIGNLFDMVIRWKGYRGELMAASEARRSELEAIRREEYELDKAEALSKGEEEPEEPEPVRISKAERVMDDIFGFIRMSFFSKEGWLPKRILMPIVAGIVLGASAFWNGAAVLTAIMVMFFFAMVADHRLEYLITALLAAGLSKLQTMFFTDGTPVVEIKMQYGFLSENTSLFGTLDYVLRLCGILIPVLLVAFGLAKGIKKWILVAFSIPFLQSFYLALTIDVTVNHKYIMLSIMLMNIFAAMVTVMLMERKGFWAKAVACLLVVLMTMTGIFDYFTVLKRNNAQSGCLTYALEDPLVDWIAENTDSKDIFLTSHYSLSRPVFGGAMLFIGHAYYPYTLGYDTNLRYLQTRQMFECKDRDTLIRMIRENLITYVIIDNDARTTGDFSLNEDIFRNTFECVYTEGSGYWEIDIYDTSKLISEEEGGC